MQLSSTECHLESKAEPFRSTFLAIRQVILAHNSEITEKLSYGLPFYFYQKKRICYLWENKKTRQPYIGFVEGKLINHPQLILGNRKRMSIFEIDSYQDLPIETIQILLDLAIELHQS